MELVVWGGLSELLYLSLYLVRPLLGAGDLKNDERFVFVAVVLGAAFGIYLWASRASVLRRASLRQIVMFAVLFNGSMLLVWRVASDDLLAYVFTGRMVAKYDANPYVEVYDDFWFDELYTETKTMWSDKTMVYGPVVLLTAGLINRVGGSNLMVNMMLFKGLFIGINVGCVYLLAKITESKRAVMLYGWNPLVIFEIAVNAHNEILVIGLVIAMGWYLKKGKYLGGWVALVGSALVKYATGLLAPFYWWWVIKRSEGESRRFTVTAGLMAGVMVVAAYAPFWEGVAIFDRLIMVYRADFISPALGIWVLGKKISNLIFWAVMAGAFYWLRKKREEGELVKVMVVVYASYLLLKQNLVLPWYLTALVALGCLGVGLEREREWMRYLVWGVSGYGLLLYWVVR